LKVRWFGWPGATRRPDVRATRGVTGVDHAAAFHRPARSPCNCSSGTPASPRRPPSRTCWPSGPDNRSVTTRSELDREPRAHRRTAQQALGRRDGASRARQLSTPATSGPWVPVVFA
jgi:hypothetical protein